MGPAASLEVDRESLVRSVVRDERRRVHRPRDRERRQRCGGRAAPGRHEAEPITIFKTEGNRLNLLADCFANVR